MHLLPENIVNLNAASTDRVHLPVIDHHDIILDVLRLDKIDPVISGNKWFKLRYYLEAALQNQQPVLTFGGAYSNHIIATAAACSKAGLKSIGIIRGEAAVNPSSTLLEAAQLGMQLQFISRNEYNQKNDPAFIQELRQQFGDVCIIPEGGEGSLGIKGASEIMQLTNGSHYTHIACAVGTGTLLAGLATAANEVQEIIGIPVLKGFENWELPLGDPAIRKRVKIITGYHEGGYAKKTSALLEFMNDYWRQTGIPLDFVYTAKLFKAITDLLEKNYFPAKSRLLLIHSGGLQGNKSLPAKTLDF